MADETLSLPALGGLARAEALSQKRKQEIAKQGADVRWNTPQATHEGVISIGEAEIPCAVLEDGTRLLSRIGFIRAIGRTGKPKGGRKYDRESKTPVFLTAENLNPFITKELTGNYNPVRFRNLDGTLVIGYRAELLPLVCNVFTDAKDAGALRQNQLHIAEACRILRNGFSTVGLAALVDEATGYQEIRPRMALRALLDRYLAKELAAWAKTFPDEFYKQIFRLQRWEWTGSVKRPRIVAKFTSDLVYSRIVPDLLKELQERNPKDERGYRKAKHFQWLTGDVGHPALAQHLHALITMMRGFDDWNSFIRFVNRALPRKTKLEDLPLFSSAAASSAPALQF